jgi:broad specificity phosphatase PhoE
MRQLLQRRRIRSNLIGICSLVTVLPPDTEPWPALATRGLRRVATWLDAHPQDSILFVSHDGLMQAIYEALSGKWFHNRHGIPVRHAPTEKGWIVEEI